MKVLIMAGGSGTRLWPLSRETYPKQFLKILGDKSLLRITYERLLKLVDHKDIIVATSGEYEYHVRNDLYPYEGYSLILEPERKNTGPTILLGMLFALEKLSAKEDEVLLVIPSDHYVKPEERYAQYLSFGEKLAKMGYMVAFGIKPSYPDTNFGYIKLGDTIFSEKDLSAYRIDYFVEKPPYQTAQNFLKEGSYMWNSGNFAFTLKVGLEEFKTNAPELWQWAQKGFHHLMENYSKLTEVAFDYIEMEKTKRGAVIPMDIEWSDIGSFEGLYRVLPRDDNGNVCVGNTLCIDTENTLAYSVERLLALVGVKNVAVVEERDALLVIKRDMSHKVKDLVGVLKKMGRREAKYHVEVHERWGKRLLLDEGEAYKIYKLTIYPNRQMGPYMHMHSTRTWMVLKGTLLFKLKDSEKYASTGENLFIGKAQAYSIKNTGFIPAELIEVRVGEYLGEDDQVLIDSKAL
jgi:mannose-1-phosphate guanylyltransferase/mannose-6-phosphate isomerase